MPLQILVDFNDGDAKGRVYLNTEFHRDLLQQLAPGLPIILFDADGLAVTALAEFHEDEKSWYAMPNWSTRFELHSSNSPDSS